MKLNLPSDDISTLLNTLRRVDFVLTDDIDFLQTANDWTLFTPGSYVPNVGTIAVTPNRIRYMVEGNKCWMDFNITFAQSTSPAAFITVSFLPDSFPVVGNIGNEYFGSGNYNDGSIDHVILVGRSNLTQSFNLYRPDGNAISTGTNQTARLKFWYPIS